MKFYGYKHWTLEDPPRCFNVGKGVKSRPISKRSRNHKWHAIVERLGLRVEVCIGPVTNEEACAWEVKNIASMGTFSTCHDHDNSSDIGCNFTRGGDGSIDRNVTLMTREKLSSAGKRHQTTTQNREDVKAKRRASLDAYRAEHGTEAWKRGAKQRFSNVLERQALSEIMTRVGQRESIKKARSENAKQRWLDPVYRQKMARQGGKFQKCGRCKAIGHNRRSCQAYLENEQETARGIHSGGGG